MIYFDNVNNGILYHLLFRAQRSLTETVYPFNSESSLFDRPDLAERKSRSLLRSLSLFNGNKIMRPRVIPMITGSQTGMTFNFKRKGFFNGIVNVTVTTTVGPIKRVP